MVFNAQVNRYNNAPFYRVNKFEHIYKKYNFEKRQCNKSTYLHKITNTNST